MSLTARITGRFEGFELECEVKGVFANSSTATLDHSVVLGRPFVKVGGVTVKNSEPMRLRAEGSVRNVQAGARPPLRIGFVQCCRTTTRSALYVEGGTFFYLYERQLYPHRDGGRDDTHPWYEAAGCKGVVEVVDDPEFSISMSDDPTFSVPVEYEDGELRRITVNDEFVTCIMAEVTTRASSKRLFLYHIGWVNHHHVDRSPEGVLSAHSRGLGHTLVPSGPPSREPFIKKPIGVDLDGPKILDSLEHWVEYFDVDGRSVREKQIF